MEQWRLPEGWVWTTLGDVADVNPWTDTSLLSDQTSVSFVPMSAVEAESGRVDATEVRQLGEVRGNYTTFQDGDVLFAKITPSMENGKSAVARTLVSGIGFGSTEFYVLRPLAGVDARFVQNYIVRAAFRRAAQGHMTGSAGQLRVPADYLKNAPFPLAPVKEQRRIVATVEEQFSRLDAGVAALKRAKVNIERYRTAVLKAAVEGRLTAAWRKENQLDVEPAPELLARILEERRERWERKQLAALKEKGRKAPKNWRSSYEPPTSPDVDDLPRLPEGWCWTNLDSLLSGIQAGKSFRCEERPPTSEEFGLVKVSAVTWGEFNELESKTCTDPDRYDPRLLISKNDFLFSRANTLDLVGACVIVRQINLSLMLSDKILRFETIKIPQGWLLFALRTRYGRDEIERLATGNQVSMRNISQKNIRGIRVPLPPLVEQKHIATEIEQRLSILQSIEAEVKANLARAMRLRQSILKRAFEGKLVPQNIEEEPASVLLTRLREEKARRKQEIQVARKLARRNLQIMREARDAKGHKQRRPLQEVLHEAGEPLKPEELYERAGFEPEGVEDFYVELREDLRNNRVKELRPDNEEVRLKVVEG